MSASQISPPFERARDVQGWWTGNGTLPAADAESWRSALGAIQDPIYVVDKEGTPAVGRGGTATVGKSARDAGEDPGESGNPLLAICPAYRLEDLGDKSFVTDHGVRYPYIAGAMANGIGSADIVESMSQAGMLGFFGSAGLPPPRVEAAIERITRTLGDAPFGFNLINSPHEPDLEAAIVDMYLKRGVKRIEASAYLRLTLPVVRFRVHGIHQDSAGRIVTPNKVIAKVSRVEVATRFLSPPPEEFLGPLVASGEITEQQANLARRVPVAQDISAEADSGGHTDNRPAVALLPTMLALRDRMQAEHRYDVPLRVGLGGGIATPASAAAAFAMGAAYILTGSINQSCIESGSSDLVRGMLAQAEQADIAMAPAADMFEMGVRVQVLKRGTMFAMRAAKLYEVYRAYASIDEIPASERSNLEKTLFRASLEEIWKTTHEFFQQRDPRQITRAEKDPKHKMALIFRWYLGMSSRWANAGEPTRQIDYQVWCGPAMGAFNEWVKGSFLEDFRERKVATVALNLLYGAAYQLRVDTLRFQGICPPAEAAAIRPLAREVILRRLAGQGG